MCDQSHTQKNIFIMLLKWHQSCSCYINLLGFCDKIVCNIDGIITFFYLKELYGLKSSRGFLLLLLLSVDPIYMHAFD